MRQYLLNGKWKLYFCKQGSELIETPNDLVSKDIPVIEAEVPGNVELDLSKAGYLPKDLYKGENILEVQKYERYEWWYVTEFNTPPNIVGRKVVLNFEGVDCLADYWLNNEKIGESKNMFIPIEIDISGKLIEGQKNILCVHIRSVMEEVYSKECPMYSLANGWDLNFDSVTVRKAPHSFGWDIMPRAVTAGIWKDVNLLVKEDVEINQIYYYCKTLKDIYAQIRLCYDLDIKEVDNMWVEASGTCADSHFYIKQFMRFKAGFLDINIENPKLWWPYGYGDANLYDTKINFYKNDALILQKTLKIGVRTVKLVKTDITDGSSGHFCFYINNVPIMCKGSNWVPMDAFHSRDASRYNRAFELVKDIGCNILRCWGGNVYEQEEFYNFCDENGIMIWQDFSMACHAYPQSEEFLQEIRKEAAIIVRKYRNHPSIILWSGDNECDQMIFFNGTDPNKNRITREVLPQVVYENDVSRPYLASSPYVSPKVVEKNRYDVMPEDHLWGPRDYFKSSYYTNSNAHFISEVGYHGCPSVDSLKRFIDEEYLWPIENNRQWNLHSSDQRNSDHRVMLMVKQIKQLFGQVPDNLEDFVYASQVTQAEAKKFFIENTRLQKPKKSGIIWWNLLDGWPQISDAIVDYYYNKKIAYDYIKRCQQPFAIMASEISNWTVKIVACNDKLKKVKGSFSVKNIEDGIILLQGEFSVNKNENTVLGEIPIMYSEQGMLLIEWTINNNKFFNHYLYGFPAFDLRDYRRWQGKLNEIT